MLMPQTHRYPHCFIVQPQAKLGDWKYVQSVCAVFGRCRQESSFVTNFSLPFQELWRLLGMTNLFQVCCIPVPVHEFHSTWHAMIIYCDQDPDWHSVIGSILGDYVCLWDTMNCTKRLVYSHSLSMSKMLHILLSAERSEVFKWISLLWPCRARVLDCASWMAQWMKTAAILECHVTDWIKCKEAT